MILRKKAFENIVGKGENADNQHFLLFPQCFLYLPKQFPIFESQFTFFPTQKALDSSNFATSLENCRYVENGENAGYDQFLLFPQCFKGLLSQGHQKSGLCVNFPSRYPLNLD